MSNPTLPTATLRTDRVRVAGLLKRKEGMSKEEFTRRWLLHADLFRSTKISEGIVKYEQMHVDDNVNALFKQMGGAPFEWDGIAILDAPSFDVIFEMTASEEFKRVIAPDEAEFMDKEKLVVFPLQFGTFLDK